MSWFLNFEGYQFPEGSFVIKEIAILNSDGGRCYNYFITSQRHILYYIAKPFSISIECITRWEFGDYELNEAMMDITRKLRSDTVYVKGREKFEYLRNLFPRPMFVELEDVPAFKNLNNCVHERCQIRHGNHCARRKVYELRHAVLQQECQ